MLLSKTDKIRFKLLYPEYSHNNLAFIFNTNREDIIGMAKGFGIYDCNKIKYEFSYSGSLETIDFSKYPDGKLLTEPCELIGIDDINTNL